MTQKMRISSVIAAAIPFAVLAFVLFRPTDAPSPASMATAQRPEERSAAPARNNTKRLRRALQTEEPESQEQQTLDRVASRAPDKRWAGAYGTVMDIPEDANGTRVIGCGDRAAVDPDGKFYLNITDPSGPCDIHVQGTLAGTRVEGAPQALDPQPEQDIEGLVLRFPKVDAEELAALAEQQRIEALQAAEEVLTRLEKGQRVMPTDLALLMRSMVDLDDDQRARWQAVRDRERNSEEDP